MHIMTEKTNVMRLLDAQKIAYVPRWYDASLTEGQAVADAVGKPRDETFKTLVTLSASGAHYVFVIPVNATLALKKAAHAVGEKSVSMLPQRELLPLTGYIHGGCSPIGMKKLFPTTVDASVRALERPVFSAGRIGYQVEMTLETLQKVVPAQVAELI